MGSRGRARWIRCFSRAACSKAARKRDAARGGSRSSLVTCTCQKTHNEGEDSRRNDAIRAATRRAEVRGRTGTHPWYTGAAARATVVASLRREEDILPVSGRSRQAMARLHALTTAVLAEEMVMPARGQVSVHHFEK